jgi:hypothetical protein
MQARGSTLQLSERTGRVKHCLDDRPVSGGDPIELCFSGGWVIGKYEWNGDVRAAPHFHYSIELAQGGGVAQGSFELPEGAVVRWPVKAG